MLCPDILAHIAVVGAVMTVVVGLSAIKRKLRNYSRSLCGRKKGGGCCGAGA